MSSKKRKTAKAAEATKRVRKVVIDSDEEEEEGHLPLDAPNQQMDGQAGEEEDDEVVEEVDVFMLSAAAAGGGGGQRGPATVNRLQFPQQSPHWLGRLFDCNSAAAGRGKCSAQYKAQVKHLRLTFGGEEERVGRPPGAVGKMGGGIADLLIGGGSGANSSHQHHPTASAQKQLDAELPKEGSELFTGEGFSQEGVFSHAVGFFSQGSLFLLPVDKTYEMRRPLVGSNEKMAREAEKAAKTAPPSAASNTLAPLRIRFARAENDLQRRRREQSSLYKQKLVEQDQWIPLRVEHSNVSELYGNELTGTIDSARVQHSSDASSSTRVQMKLADLLF